MKRILFVSNDVMFWARVQSAATAAGTEARRVGDEAGMEAAFRDGGVSRVIFDLGSRAVDAGSWTARWKGTSPAPQLIAFGSHVDEAALAAAKSAGIDFVMANSQFHRTMAEWLR